MGLRYELKSCLIAVLTVFSWTFNSLSCFPLKWGSSKSLKHEQLQSILAIVSFFLNTHFSLKISFSAKIKLFALHEVDNDNLALFWCKANHRFFVVSFLTHSYWAEF